MSTNSIIWMGDIEPTMTEKDIMSYFNKFNIKPQNVKLIKDKKTNENKNYCFIYFKTVKEANTVLFNLNGIKIPGTPYTFRLNWANSRSSFNKSAYVGNLNPKVDDLKLFNLFKKRYPTVHHASVITENGKSKGYGFVLFNGKEEYEKSLKEMNGTYFYGNIIKVKEQKKKNNDKNNENSIDNEDYSSSMNDSEQNYDGQFDYSNSYNNSINNNINNNNNVFKSSLFNLDSISNINNNQIINNNNKNIININNTLNDMFNCQINNIGINSPFKNINTINNSNINNNKIAFNYNIANDKILFSNINNNINTINTINTINNNDKRKKNISNNSIVSLNSFNSEQMSNYSTAEKFNNKKTHKKGKKEILEILEPIDECTLFKKINDSIKKIFTYYKENPFHGDKKINCKYIYNYITFFLILVSNMFLYYLTAVPLEN